jgi:hypothetical protein
MYQPPWRYRGFFRARLLVHILLRLPESCFQETPMANVADEPPDEVGHFPIAVVLERHPATSRWAEYVWTAAGIAVARHASSEPRLVREDGDSACFLVGGLEVRLHVDECESYYHNLVSDAPRAYVVARQEAGEHVPPRPFLVSMSFDEAHAYLEGDDEIYAVEVPPELYRWTEAYVIANYFPEEKTKRRLRDWTADEPGVKRT